MQILSKYRLYILNVIIVLAPFFIQFRTYQGGRNYKGQFVSYYTLDFVGVACGIIGVIMALVNTKKAEKAPLLYRLLILITLAGLGGFQVFRAFQ